MFLSKIEEMADISYLVILSKIMFFLSQLATLDTQDTWPRQTQQKHSIICVEHPIHKTQGEENLFFWNNKIIYVSNINIVFFLQKLLILT
jgi:hypothetical protein